MNPANLATVIIASKAGRLGNRLFLSAYFMANALAQGYRLLNPAIDEYGEFFEGSRMDPFCRFPYPINYADTDFASQCRTLVLTTAGFAASCAAAIGLPGVLTLDLRNSHDQEDRDYDLCGEDYSMLLGSCRTLLVKGWKFRDDKNLLRFHSEITRYFMPVKSIQKAAGESVQGARESGDMAIGIHIRQGDYRGWKGGMHYFENSQYAYWMHEAEKLFSERKVVFVICSSEPINLNAFKEHNIATGPGTAIGDLHALSLCDAIMGPPSTFSTWASYHGRVPLCMLQHREQNITKHDFVMHDRA